MKQYVKCTGYSGSPSVPLATCEARKKAPQKYPRCAECEGGHPIHPPAGIGEPAAVAKSTNSGVEGFRKETAAGNTEILDRRELRKSALLDVPDGKKAMQCLPGNPGPG